MKIFDVIKEKKMLGKEYLGETAYQGMLKFSKKAKEVTESLWKK